MKSPKYVRHLIRETLHLDSAAFLYRDRSREPLYVISDRYSPFNPEEEPVAVVSLIKEGNRDFQMRLAVRGEHHVEKPSYYVKDPNEWVEWIWIIIPKRELLKLCSFLVRVFKGGERFL